MIVQADDIQEALEGIHKGMKDTLSDYDCKHHRDQLYGCISIPDQDRLIAKREAS